MMNVKNDKKVAINLRSKKGEPLKGEKNMKKFIGKKVIIRGDRSGVFYGTLANIEKENGVMLTELKDVCRLWRWEGANSCTEIAHNGVAEKGTLKTVSLASLILTDVIEINLTTEIAQQRIEKVQVWTQW